MITRTSTQTNTWLFALVLLILWTKPANAADWLYSIKPGDTLWSICEQYAKEPNCWQKLGPFNQIDQNRQIPPGTRIRMPAAWLKVPAASATIVFAQGDVKYQHFGEAEAVAKIGIKLPIGSQLTTGKGTVTIIFADGSSMVLEPHSQLELDTLSHFELNGMVDSSVRLKRGTVKTRVIKREPRSQFRTITPSAVASVRGTEYRVNIATADTEHNLKEATLVEVYDGLVEVGAERKNFPVPASFGIVTKKGQAPQAPVRLLGKPQFLAFEKAQTLVPITSSSLRSLEAKHAPITIAWQTIDSALSYQLNILKSQTKGQSTDQLLQAHPVTANKVELTNLTPGCYQLSLRAVDQLGLHGLAANKSLCLSQQLPAPTIELKNVENQPSEQVNITWNAINKALAYRVEASRDVNFSTLVHSAKTPDTNLQLHHPSELFIRVQALDVNGAPSNYSQVVHWQPPEEKVETLEHWPVYVQIGLFLLGLL